MLDPEHQESYTILLTNIATNVHIICFGVARYLGQEGLAS